MGRLLPRESAMILPAPRAPLPLLILTLGMSACLPELKDDTAACAGPEICNGVDDDCDSLIDENATDAETWHPDADGDGYGDSATSTISCEQPTGYVAEDKATGANADCDDSDDHVYPGADETWYDGVDSDCSGGSDYDQDGDGYDHEAFDGDDCDDDNADIHPGQSEVWYDGIDGDCDGADDYDQDGDGSTSAEHGGDDCDDLDDAIHPDADETWYDGVDGDCDEASDYDQDGDGYESDAYGGTDCDDVDEFVYPGAEEAWYDNVDSDCDGANDYDQDGDGFDSDEYGGSDCDDTEPAVHPHALEWADGEDNNCDGTRDGFTLDAAPVVIDGDTGGDYFGCSLAGVGDVNADGYDDVLVGAYGNDDGARDAGGAYLFLGPVTSTSLGSAHASLLGWNTGGMAGYSIAGAGDVNSDGYADLALSAPWEGSETSKLFTGAVYLVHGPVTGDLDMDGDADARIQAEQYDDGAGWCVSGGIDATGDAVPDLLVGATDTSMGADHAGGAYLVDGTTTGDTSFASAVGSAYSNQAYAFAGTSVALVDDADGDGIGDILVGAPSYDDGDGSGGTFSDVGQAYIHYGPISGSLDLGGDADGILRGEHGGDRAGDCVANAGDVTGDGYGDFLVGAPQAGNGASRGPGKIYLIQGPFTGEGYMHFVYTATFQGPSDDDEAALCPAAAAGDVDLDGVPDLLVGAYQYDSLGSDIGAAWLSTVTFGGTLTTASADLELIGAADGDNAGYSLAGAGDTNADGWPDLLVGAPYADTTATDAGAAYLLLGSPMIP